MATAQAATNVIEMASATPNDSLLAIALMLVIGALAGEFIARFTRLPRVVGYTVAGMAAAAFGQGAAMPLTGAMQAVVDVAMALLLFEIGSRVNLRWLRRNPGLMATSLAESMLGAAAVAATLLALDFSPYAAAVCAVLTIPASAAVAGRVALELGAEGQVTQRMALLTAMNTLYAALAVIVVQLWWTAGEAPEVATSLLAMGRSFVGSLALAGALTGAVVVAAQRLDLRNQSAVLLLLGLVILAVTSAREFGLSTLLVPLLAGLLLRNLTDRPWVWPRHFGTAGGAFVLILFVIVGASWTPEALLAGGLGALAVILVRGLAKACAVLALSRWSRVSLRQGLALSITLTPLSGAALVLLSELMRDAPGLAQGAMPVVLTSIAVLELLGPIAVQAALKLAGELDPSKSRRSPENAE